MAFSQDCGGCGKAIRILFLCVFLGLGLRVCNWTWTAPPSSMKFLSRHDPAGHADEATGECRDATPTSFTGSTWRLPSAQASTIEQDARIRPSCVVSRVNLRKVGAAALASTTTACAFRL